MSKAVKTATDDKDIAFYVNRPEHQSILDLWHAQVFVKLHSVE